MHVCMMHMSMILDPDTCMYLCSLILDTCMYDARMVHASMMRNFSVTEGRMDEQGDSRSRMKIMSFNIIPVANEYQEIHPFGALNIDNVKINTTMMREWPIFKQHMGSCQKPGFL